MRWIPLLVLPLLFTSALSANAHSRARHEEKAEDVTPAEMHAEIFAAWKGPLLDFRKNLKPGRNYVAWLLVPPTRALDMRSAGQFRRSYLATPPKDFSISHNLVLWQCTRRDGTRAEGAMAISGESDEQSKLMVKHGFGLTPLFSNFTDGYLQGVTDLLDIIDENGEDGRGYATVAFEVTQDDCNNMMDFADAFSLDPKRPYANFGNFKDPEKFEGGGCVTLAETLLRRAGVLSELWPAFWRTFHVNRHLLGGNLPLPEHVQVPAWKWLGHEERYVPELALLLNPHWDGDRDTGYETLPLMDPELMLYSLRGVAQSYVEGLPPAERATEEAKIARSSFGRREAWSAVEGALVSLPEGYVKRHRVTPLNDSFDPRMARVSWLMRRWWENARSEGYGIRSAHLGKSLALIVDKP